MRLSCLPVATTCTVRPPRPGHQVKFRVPRSRGHLSLSLSRTACCSTSTGLQARPRPTPWPGCQRSCAQNVLLLPASAAENSCLCSAVAACLCNREQLPLFCGCLPLQQRTGASVLLLPAPATENRCLCSAVACPCNREQVPLFCCCLPLRVSKCTCGAKLEMKSCCCLPLQPLQWLHRTATAALHRKCISRLGSRSESPDRARSCDEPPTRTKLKLGALGP